MILIALVENPIDATKDKTNDHSGVLPPYACVVSDRTMGLSMTHMGGVSYQSDEIFFSEDGSGGGKSKYMWRGAMAKHLFG